MRLQREPARDDCTFGIWYDDNGSVLFQTLEPRNPMPAGRRAVVLRFSPTHGYAVPGFLNVPGHDNIEMHPGNWPRDTKDCVLPGALRGYAVDSVENGGDGQPHDMVTDSRATFAAFMAKIGVPNYRELRDWDAVREFLQANPGAGRFIIDIVDAPA